jgi:hypothetical protein
MLSTINNSNTGRLRFRLKAGSSSTTTLIAGAGEITEGEWTHVTGVYDGSTMRLYQNGVEVGVANQTGAIAASGASVFIGANPPNVARTWDGRIRDVRIYDRALTLDEIEALATAP